MSFKLSRRNLLKGAAAIGGAAAGSGLVGPFANKAYAQTIEKPALLVVFLRGGYNALFGSADSFVGAGSFGVTSSNSVALGNGLVVDAPTFGTLPTAAKTNMAQIGVNHGLSSHDPARIADWGNGSRSYALMLANAMGGTAAIKAAVLGSAMPDGPAPAENGISLQQITDLAPTISALGATTTDTTLPDRTKGLAALTAARTLSQGAFAANPNSLRVTKDAYDSAVGLLSKPVQTFDYAAMSAAYGVSSTSTTVGSNFTLKMLGAELMITAGANVAIAINDGWDTHGDTTGQVVRDRMTATILPGLRTFASRMLTATGRNVTIAIIGDFARSLPGSDHARCVSATVMGKRVRLGTDGRVTSAVGLPTGSPGTAAFWSYLADLSRVSSNPFGTDPHSALILP
jgi:hypothetical protein